MKRPLLIVTISYILGIIIGVYFKQSILLILLTGITGIVFWEIIKKKKRDVRRKGMVVGMNSTFLNQIGLGGFDPLPSDWTMCSRLTDDRLFDSVDHSDQKDK